MRLMVMLVGLALHSGCASPEDGRPRGGGHGGDASNYATPVHVPSKIDDSKAIPKVGP